MAISPYAGLRHTELDVTLIVNEGGLEEVLLLAAGVPDELQADEHWLGLGLIGQLRLSDHWQFIAKLDAAGLGIGYNDYWSALAAFHYQITDHWAVAGGNREPDFDAEPGGGNTLALRLHAKGPLAGIAFSF